MTTIISGATRKPLVSEKLKNLFSINRELDGYLYIGYPLIGTPEGGFSIDATYISPTYGLIIFNLVENKVNDDYDDLQDNSFNKMEAKLRAYKNLVIKRRLAIPINVITFYSNNDEQVTPKEEYPLCNELNLIDTIKEIDIWDDDNSYYEKLVSVLQSISNLRSGGRKRNINNPSSRGAKLRSLEDSIANLDNQQGKAVIETVEGVQRIRGLAGSGKTIILALKAAYLHAQNPDWKIAITFNTRSLKRQFKQLIETFFIEQTSEQPNWENIKIIHAWGSSSEEGMYYNFIKLQPNAEYYDFQNAKQSFGYEKAFHKACELALTHKTINPQIYDAILVDEAQDFSPDFLKICYLMLKEPTRLVYAYDELQNLSTETLPSPEIMFGNRKDGTPVVKFEYERDGTSKQDIILEKCYRNSKPLLTTAHALGFGIYRESANENDTGLVQMFEQSDLWNEVGYNLVDGSLKSGEFVDLVRDEKTSPKFLENHSPVDDLLMFKTFDTREEQDNWVSEQIKINLDEDELLYNDIIVINPDPLKTRDAVSKIRRNLFDMEIPSHTVGVGNSRDEFFSVENDSISFTGIYRAKGNEAAMVYIINAQDCYSGPSSELARKRNQLFTAITRSKAWVRVIGFGADMKKLTKEYEQVKENDFHLKFNYPTKEQLDKLKIINRDRSEGEQQIIKQRNSELQNISEALERGELYKEDLDLSLLQKIASLLNESNEEG